MVRLQGKNYFQEIDMDRRTGLEKKRPDPDRGPAREAIGVSYLPVTRAQTVVATCQEANAQSPPAMITRAGRH